MTPAALSKMTSRGRITLPRQIREGLGVQVGESVALQEVAKGIVLLVKAPLSQGGVADHLLERLTVSIGQDAEKKAIRDEDDLDVVVKALRKRSFEHRYGSQAV